jgi:hypothetical protein
VQLFTVTSHWSVDLGEHRICSGVPKNRLTLSTEGTNRSYMWLSGGIGVFHKGKFVNNSLTLLWVDCKVAD